MKLLQPSLQFVRNYSNKTILLHFQNNFLCAWNFYVVLPIDPYHKSALSNSSGWWGFDLTKNDNELQIAIDLGTSEVVALLLKMFDQLRTSIHDMDASALDNVCYVLLIPFHIVPRDIFSLSDWMRKWLQERRSNNPEMGDSVDRMARLVANSIPQVWIGRTNLEQGKFWFNYKDIAGAPPKNKDFLGCAHT